MRMGHAGRLTMAELLCGSMGRYSGRSRGADDAISDIATDIACSVGGVSDKGAVLELFCGAG